MLESGVFLQYYGSSGSSLGNLLARWDAAGIFDFALPFLLIFALVFTVLGNLPLFGNNKGVNSVIGIAVALMSLQFGFVSQFFSEIFPTFGAILGVLLLVMVFLGFVGDKTHSAQKWTVFIFALVSVAIIISKAFSVSTYFGGGGGGLGSLWFYLSSNLGSIIFVALFVGAIIAVINIQPSGNVDEPEPAVFFPDAGRKKK